MMYEHERIIVGLNSSSMFRMMAGLSMPDNDRTRIPQRTTNDIDQFYITHCKKVFFRSKISTFLFADN